LISAAPAAFAWVSVAKIQIGTKRNCFIQQAKLIISQTVLIGLLIQFFTELGSSRTDLVVIPVPSFDILKPLTRLRDALVRIRRTLSL
jgi:hypothetical protein